MSVPVPYMFTHLSPAENVDPETIWVLEEYGADKQCNFTSLECLYRAQGGTPRIGYRTGMVCWLTEVHSKLWVMSGHEDPIENLDVSQANPTWNDLGTTVYRSSRAKIKVISVSNRYVYIFGGSQMSYTPYGHFCLETLK